MAKRAQVFTGFPNESCPYWFRVRARKLLARLESVKTRSTKLRLIRNVLTETYDEGFADA